jgi:hypothetical protein
MDFRLRYNGNRTYGPQDAENDIANTMRSRLTTDPDGCGPGYENAARECRRNRDFINSLSYMDIYPALILAKLEYEYDIYLYKFNHTDNINNDDCAILSEHINILYTNFDILLDECIEDLEDRMNADWEKYNSENNSP